MPIQTTTARDAELAARRAEFVARNGLKDFKLSGRSLMRMVRRCCVDKALVDRIRERFTHHYGTDLRMEGETWDHLEMFGRKGHLVVLVAHPYHVTDAGREDMALFHRAGLNVVEGGTDESWYGFGSTQIRVEHPALAGRMLPPPASLPKVEPPRPAPPTSRPLVESTYTSRLYKAASLLLQLARERADELTAALRLVACVGPRGVGPCLSCELRDELDRINALIAEVEGPDR